jgi:hypothetical protein
MLDLLRQRDISKEIISDLQSVFSKTFLFRNFRPAPSSIALYLGIPKGRRRVARSISFLWDYPSSWPRKRVFMEELKIIIHVEEHESKWYSYSRNGDLALVYFLLP